MILRKNSKGNLKLTHISLGSIFQRRKDPKGRG